MQVIAICAAVTAGYQLVFGTISAIFKTGKLTDFAGGSNFVIIAITSCALTVEDIANVDEHRKLLLTSIITIWGVRLVGYLFYRILTVGKDERLDEVMKKPVTFVIFWVFQAIWVMVVSLPVLIVNSSDSPIPLFGTAQDYVGCILVAIGFAAEAVADNQKFKFKQNESNNGKWCNVGLWKWSRHPNYFGEIVFWWGAFTVSTSVLVGWEWVAVASPLLTMTLLLFLSGAPILEKKANSKYRDNEEYLTYKERTSPLIPLPPSLWTAFPYWAKVVLFEYPMYRVPTYEGSRSFKPKTK